MICLSKMAAHATGFPPLCTMGSGDKEHHLRLLSKTTSPAQVRVHGRVTKTMKQLRQPARDVMKRIYELGLHHWASEFDLSMGTDWFVHYNYHYCYCYYWSYLTRNISKTRNTRLLETATFLKRTRNVEQLKVVSYTGYIAPLCSVFV